MELVLKNVEKKYKDFVAVSDLTLSMKNGVYGLLGVNGAGKTTLMRMICTLIKPTKGEILCNGKDIYQMDSQYRKLIGYLPQDFGYYPDFSIKDYLLYISSLKGLQRIVAEERTEYLINQVGLQKYQNRKMKNLSGGMLRRAGIAQAMLNNPRILVLDEPTAGLDPNERVRFRNLISELSEDRLVLLSTHIVSDVEYIANEILLMKSGCIKKRGSSTELIETMHEKVWICNVNKELASKLNRDYKVSNIKMEGSNVVLRIIAEEQPIDGAVKTEPTLEDLFLSYFDEKGECANEV